MRAARRFWQDSDSPRQKAILRSFMVKKRCEWVGESNPLMLEYHDREWGVPVHDDTKHFEFLVLEGAQAGLSWSIVLNKRGGYRRAFSEFDPQESAWPRMTAAEDP